MRGFYAVFRKETANFFVSPIAYVVLAIFLLISGYIFWTSLLFMAEISIRAANIPGVAQQLNVTDFIIRPLVQNMGFVLLFIMPLVSMRLFSEEKKSGSIELLLTYPVTDAGVLAGKYLAAIVLLLIMLAGTLPMMLLLFALGQPDLGTLLSGYLGLALLGCAFLALGIFISSLTENQIIAGTTTFGASILFWIVGWSSTFSGQNTGAVLKQLAILHHLQSFDKGIIALTDLSFFVLFTAFFLFLTLRTLETYRWRG
jgi:gliding motility-associated transport system permease protein